MATDKPTPTPSAPSNRRRYVSQADVPRHSLDEALRVARALADQYGKGRATPLEVAEALQIQPTTGTFRTLAGASLAYGLTDGGPAAESIGLTDLGLRVVAPTEEGDDLAAMREALLRPRVVREFLEKYDGSKLPTETIGRNVLERMDVPAEATARTLDLITDGASSLGLLRVISGERFVSLRGITGFKPAAASSTADQPDEDLPPVETPAHEVAPRTPRLPTEQPVSPKDSLLKSRRVFISHGSNKKIVEQLKELLAYGDFEPVVSIETESTAKPVPQKVLGEMRSCGAGIIHVGKERTGTDQAGNELILLNENVLIEIGAAMALYGSNYILLVEEGAKLPSNLQGLYEARYNGDSLDHDATMKLLRTLKEFKTP